MNKNILNWLNILYKREIDELKVLIKKCLKLKLKFERSIIFDKFKKILNFGSDLSFTNET